MQYAIEWAALYYCKTFHGILSKLITAIFHTGTSSSFVVSGMQLTI